MHVREFLAIVKKSQYILVGFQNQTFQFFIWLPISNLASMGNIYITSVVITLSLLPISENLGMCPKLCFHFHLNNYCGKVAIGDVNITNHE